MEVQRCNSAADLGFKAAHTGAKRIKEAILARGEANIIVATGASQFDTLSELVKNPDIDWSKVRGFHLDEYIGMDRTHPASFCRYLQERFVDQVKLKEFHFVDGKADPVEECKRLGELISKFEIDIAFVGIGENGHLAFNDPPADFEVESPYIIAELNHACRIQQVGEGWFDSLDQVPLQAISMSIKQVMKSRCILCSVPDKRKSEAVRETITGRITPRVPASILQSHQHAFLFLDPASSSRIDTLHEVSDSHFSGNGELSPSKVKFES